MSKRKQSRFKAVLRTSFLYQLFEDELGLSSILNVNPHQMFSLYLIKNTNGKIIPIFPLEVALYNHTVYLTRKDYLSVPSYNKEFVEEIINNATRDAVLYESIKHSKDEYYLKRLTKGALLINMWFEILGYSNPFGETPYINKCIWCFVDLEESHSGVKYLCSHCKDTNTFSNVMNRNLGYLDKSRKLLTNVFWATGEQEKIKCFKDAKGEIKKVGKSFARKIKNIPLNFEFSLVSKKEKRQDKQLEQYIKDRKDIRQLAKDRKLTGIGKLDFIRDATRIAYKIRQERIRALVNE